MLAYSARKNSANAMPEYSTWKPATISDSPSATSKGARLVSATPEMKYTTNSGNSQDQFQREHAACLGRDDVAEVQAAGGHEHAHQREAHGDLVGDDLRRRAHRAQERVLRVRRPAGEDDAVDAHRGERQQVQQARHRRWRCTRSGDSGITAQVANAGTSAMARRQAEQELVRLRRDDDFLDQQLDDVGERLPEPGQQAEDARRGSGRGAAASSR